MNDRTISTVTTTSRRSVLVRSVGVLAAAGLSATTLATAAEAQHPVSNGVGRSWNGVLGNGVVLSNFWAYRRALKIEDIVDVI